ncbi:hypothetical protein Tco_0613553 [Tanacetum coccineum]
MLIDGGSGKVRGDGLSLETVGRFRESKWVKEIRTRDISLGFVYWSRDLRGFGYKVLVDGTKEKVGRCLPNFGGSPPHEVGLKNANGEKKATITLIKFKESLIST